MRYKVLTRSIFSGEPKLIESGKLGEPRFYISGDSEARYLLESSLVSENKGNLIEGDVVLIDVIIHEDIRFIMTGNLVYEDDMLMFKLNFPHLLFSDSCVSVKEFKKLDENERTKSVKYFVLGNVYKEDKTYDFKKIICDYELNDKID